MLFITFIHTIFSSLQIQNKYSCNGVFCINTINSHVKRKLCGSSILKKQFHQSMTKVSAFFQKLTEQREWFNSISDAHILPRVVNSHNNTSDASDQCVWDSVRGFFAAGQFAVGPFAVKKIVSFGQVRFFFSFFMAKNPKAVGLIV